MENLITRYEPLLQAMPPITLEEMSAIRLMNRTDKKFVTDTDTLARLLTRARGNYYAQRTGELRMAPYTTTYFDTPDQPLMFRTHLCGHIPRTKVRVRTYLDTGHTFLEVKRKDNHGKTRKRRISVPSLPDVVKNRAGEDFLRELTGWDFSQVRPAITNRFQRITLVNLAKTERLTIDFALGFTNLVTGRGLELPTIVIIELKRDGLVPSPILPLLRELRIKPSGFSKYCIGTALTAPGLPQNRLKERLRRIQKIAAQAQH